MSGRRCTYGDIIIVVISLRPDGGGGEIGFGWMLEVQCRYLH